MISYLLELCFSKKKFECSIKEVLTPLCIKFANVVLLSPFSLRNCLNLSLTLLVYVDLQDKKSSEVLNSNHAEEFVEAKKIEQSFTEPW